MPSGRERLTDAIYRQRLKRALPTVKPVGRYVLALQPVEVLCTVCDKKWKARPHDLWRGHGCGHCHGLYKTTASFRKEVSAISSNIRILGEYIADSERIKVRCKTCKHEWTPKANQLLNGCGCPS